MLQLTAPSKKDIVSVKPTAKAKKISRYVSFKFEPFKVKREIGKQNLRALLHDANNNIYEVEINSFPNVPNVIEKEKNFKISIGNNRYSIDRQLVHILKSINDSKVLLDLLEDWDEEGALPCLESTYKRAIEILILYSQRVLNNYGIKILAPDINLVRDGSIDLEWRSNDWILLLNIQNTEDVEIHFYGEDLNTNRSIKGILDNLSVDEDLAFWMKKLNSNG